MDVTTVTSGELALLLVGATGATVTGPALRASIRRYRWIRWSGNDRACRVARRQVRAVAARFVAFLVAAGVGAASALIDGRLFPGAGVTLALGLGATVVAATLDAVEGRVDRRAPDVRAELEAEDDRLARVPPRA
jgi:hypothetical protein